MHQALPPWWDRETDEVSGEVLRPDVRESAHEVWGTLCFHAQRALGDTSDAPELIESAVKAISRYLDKHNAELFSADLKGLLSLAFHRSVMRLARKRRRLVTMGGSYELASLLQTPEWSEAASRRLLLEQLANELSPMNRAVLRLRICGYGWKEIGLIFQTTPVVARKTFWRAVRGAQFRLAQPREITPVSSRKGKGPSG
jgi:DNA-directed RNA polymerase specialized sigma24 family protein